MLVEASGIIIEEHVLCLLLDLIRDEVPAPAIVAMLRAIGKEKASRQVQFQNE